jgi:hypothetical protein
MRRAINTKETDLSNTAGSDSLLIAFSASPINTKSHPRYLGTGPQGDQKRDHKKPNSIMRSATIAMLL